jgi:hypothetical protein
MGTIGYADRLRFPGFPSKVGKREMLTSAPIPIGTSINKDLKIEDVGITLSPTPMPSIGPAS